MSFLTRVEQRIASALRPKAAGDAAIPIDFAGSSQNWAEDNLENFAREGYGRNELVFSCIREISTSAAEIRLRAVTPEEGGDVKERPGTPLARLLARPNPQQSQYEFLEQLHTYLDIAGHNYTFKERDRRGQVIAIYNLRPERLRIVPGGDHIAGYVYTVGNRKYDLAAEDVGMVKYPNPWGDYYGLSPLHVLAKTVNLDTNMTDFAKVFFQNGGVPSGFLMLKKKLHSADEANKIRQRWQSQFAAHQNWHRLAILDEDAEYKQIAIDLDKMAMVDLRNVSESRICQVLGVPAIVVGANVGLDHSTYANYAEARLSFWQETLSPRYRRIVDALNVWLAPEFPNQGDIDVDLSKVTALQDDLDKLFTRWGSAFKDGWVMKNEARKGVGLREVKGGNVFRLQINFVEYEEGQKPQVIFSDAGKPQNPMTVPPSAVNPADVGTEDGGGKPAAPKSEPEPEAPASDDGKARVSADRAAGLLGRLGPHARSYVKALPEPDQSTVIAKLLERPSNVRLADWAVTVLGFDRDSKADSTDDTVSVREARSRKVDAFATALLPLWDQLESGDIDPDEYHDAVEQLFDEAVGDVPDEATETITRLRDQALQRADDFALHFLDDEDNEDISDGTRGNWANMVAGAVWGATLAVAAYNADGDTATWSCEDDDNSCDDCVALDGNEWPVDEVPFWPGEGETACQGNCRCELVVSGESVYGVADEEDEGD